jgi:hypothetical protein
MGRLRVVIGLLVFCCYMVIRSGYVVLLRLVGPADR